MKATRRILRENDDSQFSFRKKAVSVQLRGKTIENCEKIDISKLYTGYYKYNTTIYRMLKDYKKSIEKGTQKTKFSEETLAIKSESLKLTTPKKDNFQS